MCQNVLNNVRTCMYVPKFFNIGDRKLCNRMLFVATFCVTPMTQSL